MKQNLAKLLIVVAILVACFSISGFALQNSHAAFYTSQTQSHVTKPLSVVNDCGIPNTFDIRYNGNLTWACYSGSGNLNVNLPNAHYYSAGGHSGYFLDKDGGDYYFCDGNSLYFSATTVTFIYLSPVKASWC